MSKKHLLHCVAAKERRPPCKGEGEQSLFGPVFALGGKVARGFGSIFGFQNEKPVPSNTSLGTLLGAPTLPKRLSSGCCCC